MVITSIRCDSCKETDPDLAHFEFGGAHICITCAQKLTLWDVDRIASSMRDQRRALGLASFSTRMRGA